MSSGELGVGLGALLGGLGSGAALASESRLALLGGLFGRGSGLGAAVVGLGLLAFAFRGGSAVVGLGHGLDRLGLLLGLGLGRELQIGDARHVHDDAEAHLAVEPGLEVEGVPVGGLGDPGGQDALALALEGARAQVLGGELAQDGLQGGLVGEARHGQLAGDDVSLGLELLLDLFDRGVADEAHGASGLGVVVSGFETRGLHSLHVQRVVLAENAADQAVLELAQGLAGDGCLHGEAQRREGVELELVQAHVLVGQLAHVAFLALVDDENLAALLLDAEHAGDAAGTASGQVVDHGDLGVAGEWNHDLSEDVGQDQLIRVGGGDTLLAGVHLLDGGAQLVDAVAVPHRGVRVAAGREHQVTGSATQVVGNPVDGEQLASGMLAIRVVHQGLPGIEEEGAREAQAHGHGRGRLLALLGGGPEEDAGHLTGGGPRVLGGGVVVRTRLTLGILGLDALDVGHEAGEAVAHEGGADHGLDESAVAVGQADLGAQAHGQAVVHVGVATVVEVDGEAGGVRTRGRAEVRGGTHSQLVVVGIHDHAGSDPLDGLARVAAEVSFLLGHEEDDILDDGDETPGAGVAYECILAHVTSLRVWCSAPRGALVVVWENSLGNSVYKDALVETVFDKKDDLGMLIPEEQINRKSGFCQPLLAYVLVVNNI